MQLRKIKDTDLDQLLLLKQESHWGTHRVAILNEEDQLHWFNNLSKDPHQPPHLFLIAHVDKEDIGTFKFTSIDWVNRRADVGWDVFAHHRQKGYGSKIVKKGVQFAKNRLNLHRLNAEILEFNIASQKCAEKAGFVKEGVKRQEIYKEGKYIDNLIYGIIL